MVTSLYHIPLPDSFAEGVFISPEKKTHPDSKNRIWRSKQDRGSTKHAHAVPAQYLLSEPNRTLYRYGIWIYRRFGPETAILQDTVA